MESTGEIVMYQSADGQTSIDVTLEKNTVWLNQYQMAELFATERSSLAKHIKNIYLTGELARDATCAKIAQVQKEGAREIKRHIEYYNLDLIISVGYRVNSLRGTQFRIWANKVLKNYLTIGYAIDRKRFERQLLQKMQQFKLKEKGRLEGKSSITIWMQYYQSGIWLTRNAVPNSGYGPTKY